MTHRSYYRKMDEILELYRKDMDTSTLRQPHSGGNVTADAGDTDILVQTSQQNRAEILAKISFLTNLVG